MADRVIAWRAPASVYVSSNGKVSIICHCGSTYRYAGAYAGHFFSCVPNRQPPSPLPGLASQADTLRPTSGGTCNGNSPATVYGSTYNGINPHTVYGNTSNINPYTAYRSAYNPSAAYGGVNFQTRTPSNTEHMPYLPPTSPTDGMANLPNTAGFTNSPTPHYHH